jgi:hypothetical protein
MSFASRISAYSRVMSDRDQGLLLGSMFFACCYFLLRGSPVYRLLVI